MSDRFATRAEVHWGRTMPCFTQRAATVDAAFRAAAARVPERIALVVAEEPLPRNANGKIQKAALHQMAAAHLAGAPRPDRVR